MTDDMERVARNEEEQASAETLANLGRVALDAEIQGREWLLGHEQGREDFESFGDLLVYLRDTYFDRGSWEGLDRPRMKLTAKAVIDYLDAHDYSMTSGSYSFMERGKTLPRNPAHFMEIVSRCLNVPATSKYHLLLRTQYIYDHTRRFVGQEAADMVVMNGSKLLNRLRAQYEEHGQVDA